MRIDTRVVLFVSIGVVLFTLLLSIVVPNIVKLRKIKAEKLFLETIIEDQNNNCNIQHYSTKFTNNRFNINNIYYFEMSGEVKYKCRKEDEGYYYITLNYIYANTQWNKSRKNF